MIFSAALLILATPNPPQTRRCGDTCQFAAETLSDLPKITTEAPGHPEKIFDGYVACLKAAVAKSALSSQSTDEELDGALQAGYEACSREREAASVTFYNAVMATRPTNSPAEVSKFSEMARELFSSSEILPFLQAKIGKERFGKYLTVLGEAFPNFGGAAL